jgi:predicted ferric reductase
VEVTISIIRFASFVIFAIGAFLCWRRWNIGHYEPWRVVGILATVLTLYRLTIFIVDLAVGPINEELSIVTTVAANVAFVLGGLAIVFCAQYETKAT